MSKHTPGPWIVTPITAGKQRGHIEIDAVAYKTASAHGAAGVATVNGLYNGADFSPGEADANARLIAAAPDLLAALEGIVSTDPSGRPMAEVTTVTLERALAAIAKARV